MRARLRRVGTTRPGLKLRKEAGRKPGVLAQLDQAHGLLEPEALDALADVLFRNESLGGFGIHLRFLRFLAANRRQFRHGLSPRVHAEQLLPQSKPIPILLNSSAVSKRTYIHRKEMAFHPINTQMSE